MAIKVNFNGATIQKPGFYGDPLEKTRPWYKRAQLIEFLAKLNIKSAKAALRPATHTRTWIGTRRSDELGTAKHLAHVRRV